MDTQNRPQTKGMRFSQLRDASSRRPVDGQVWMFVQSEGKWVPSTLDIDNEHDHDEDYAPLVHNHDELYSPLGHDHDADYAPLDHDHDADYAAIDHDHDSDYRKLSDDITNSDIANGTIQEAKLHADVQAKLNASGGITYYSQVSVTGGALNSSTTQLVSQIVPAGTYMVWGGFQTNHSTGFVQTMMVLRRGTTEESPSTFLQSNLSGTGITLTHAQSWLITLASTTTLNIAARAQNGSANYTSPYMQIIKVA